MNLFEKAALPTVLKRLKLKHHAAQIMIELYNLLRTRAEMKKFKETACRLIGMAMPVPSEEAQAAEGEATANGSPPAVAGESLTASAGRPCTGPGASLDAMEDLRQKTEQQEAEILELRSKLSSNIDACLERERAEEERARAAGLQKRVIELERERRLLVEQIREARELHPELERVKGRVVRSVQQISESLQALQGDEAKPRSARSVDSLRDWEEDDAESAAGSFRAALSRLDSLVIALPSTVQDVAAEMQQLKQRCDELETASLAPTADPEDFL